MNDFTKEELSSILDSFYYARDSARWTKYHEEPKLINKIQAMIDDRCDNPKCKLSKHSSNTGCMYE